MPTADERSGDFSESPIAIRDPSTGLPFSGNVIPADRISPQAAALLGYYPLPNGVATAGPNYQTAVLSAATNDDLQFAASKGVTRRDTIDGNLAFRRTVTDATTLFDFEDESRSRRSMRPSTGRAGSRRACRPGCAISSRGRRRTSRRSSPIARTSRATPASRATIRTPANWGPPTLSFPDVAGLTTPCFSARSPTRTPPAPKCCSGAARTTSRSAATSAGTATTSSRSPNPRGTLAFTGAAHGRRLCRLPARRARDELDRVRRRRFASARQRLDAYVNDDWRLSAD